MRSGAFWLEAMATSPDDLITVAIPRSALAVTAPPPSRVDQSTVTSVVGLPRKVYLQLCRQGAWPVTKAGRLLLAKTADVEAYLDAHAKRLRPRGPASRKVEEFDELPAPKGFRHAS